MNYKFPVCEEKAVRFNFPWGFNYCSFFLVTEFRQIIDELPGVSRSWDDEAKHKLVRTDHLPAEIVALNHFHLFDGLVSYAKVEGQAYHAQLQEVWSQMVLYYSSIGIILVADVSFVVLLRHVNESYL